MLTLQFTESLFCALMLGALIGIERQWRQRMAGLRTNALVSLGTAVFILTVKELPDATGMARMAAQIVSGIGFLGAGVIMRDGLNVRGLNTAATLWCSAGIGTLSGLGLYQEATIGAFFILGANLLLRPLAQKLNHSCPTVPEEEVQYQVRILCNDASEEHLRYLLLQSVTSGELTLRGLRCEGGLQSKTEVIADLESTGRKDQLLEQMVSRLCLEKGVFGASWLKKSEIVL